MRDNNIQDTKYISDRILQTTLRLHEKILTHIVSVYASDITKPQKEKEDFYRMLQATMDNIPRQDEAVVLGDLNARIGNEIIAGIKNRFNEDTTKDNGEMLTCFCAMNELRINNTFYLHKPQHKFTYENTRGQKSTIDYIITSRNIHPSKILDVRVLCSANTGTNHNLVLAKIRKNTFNIKTKPRKITEKLNMESISDETTKNLYRRRLEQRID